MGLLTKYREQYPQLFETCFEVWLPQGWVPVIEKQLPVLEAIRVRTGLPVQIAQIKEKFGGLRFYMESLDNSIYVEVHDIIDEMEKETEKTCETCGSKEKVSLDAKPGSWVRTKCEKCRGGEA